MANFARTAWIWGVQLGSRAEARHDITVMKLLMCLYKSVFDSLFLQRSDQALLVHMLPWSRTRLHSPYPRRLMRLPACCRSAWYLYLTPAPIHSKQESMNS